MKLSLTILLVFSLLLQSNAQPANPFVLQKKIAGDFSDFTVDNLNNIFLFTNAGQLKKLSNEGDSIAVFNDVRRYGKRYAVDVSNPLKVLIYFKDFGTLLVLDRFLSRRETIDLRRLGMYQVKSIGQAYDNGYWVFDEQEAKLKHLNDAAQVVDQFTDFRLLFDSMPSPQYITDQNKTLYLYDSTLGVYLFDYFGAFKSRIPFVGWKDFMVINSVLFGRDEQYLYRYEPGSLQLQQFAISKEMAAARAIHITPEFLYVLQSDGLEIYSYQRN